VKITSEADRQTAIAILMNRFEIGAKAQTVCIDAPPGAQWLFPQRL